MDIIEAEAGGPPMGKGVPTVLSRYDWNPAARDQFFGPEPGMEDPLPIHERAVGECRTSLSVSRSSAVGVVAADETTSQWCEVSRFPEISDTHVGARPMRVVLMGRTMAGKSTLLSALTGGSTERIGVGAQRTSRDVFAAPAAGLSEVEIVDTPGVGAKDGAQDVEIAMAEVPSADLVLWVASNDSFQEETAQALRRIALRGKPIVVALNCREALVDDLAREDFLRDPDAVFDQHEGHLRVIRSHLVAAGVRPLREVLLHAEAARQARSGLTNAAELWEASRGGDLLDVLDQESRDRRTVRRLIRDADEVRSQGQELLEVIADAEGVISESVSVSRGLRLDQERRSARLVDACQQRIDDRVVHLVGKRRGWHQTISDFGPDVQKAWDKERKILVAEVEDFLNAQLTNLRKVLDEMAVETEREWTFTVRFGPKVRGIRDFRGLWRGKVFGLVVGVGGALASGAIVGALGGPVGFVAGAISSVAIAPARRKGRSLFTSKAKILESNRALLGSKLAEALDEFEGSMRTDVEETMTEIRTDLASAFAGPAETESLALAVAGQLAYHRVDIDRTIAALDLHTVRCLLLADERPRLAASVKRATRLPGVCVAVEVPDQACAEAWLFPPSVPERLSFGRATSTVRQGAGATTYVLGLTEEVPTYTIAYPDRTEVATDASVPEPVLAAWSANLSDHLGARIDIVRPNLAWSGSE